MIRRRHFLKTVGAAGLLMAYPFAAPAQQRRAMPVIGFLNSGESERFGHLVAGFRKGLAELGIAEGHNVAIEYRWAEGVYGRTAALATELVRLRVDVLAATGNTAPEARAATTTIPTVFIIGGDPVKMGLVASLARPGGNLTGLTQFTGPLDGKRLGLLRDLLPNAASFGILVNPTYTNFDTQLSDIQTEAARTGVRVVIARAVSVPDFAPAFKSFADNRVDGLVIGSDPFFNSRRAELVPMVAQLRVPAIYEWREFAEIGGLMSYGSSLTDGYRQIGAYTGRVLKGERPADLPVLQPTKFELVVNLKTAKAVGFTVPQSILLRADDVIE